jgi:pimeloyl-ACP methyl ester carboxylesterase
MRAAGDVIALDQRGAGLSEPNLTCPGALDFPLTSAGDFTPMLERLADRSHSCASFWRDRGVDLTAYNVVENAGDLESLRQALGVKKISLWGSSYGTHLALAVIRHHGEHIHRAVLAGVEGPDHTLKLPSAAEQQLDVLGKLVASDPDLSRDIPDLVSLVRRVFATAERKPFTIVVIDPESKKTTTVTLGRFDLEQTVISMLGDREGLERLPRMLLAFERADLSSPLVQMAARLAVEDRTGPIGSAMSFAMDCASGASKERIARVERETRAGLLGHIDFPFPEICSAWGVPELPPSERTLVRSNVPVLFISGTLDGHTPPSNAEEAQRGFPNSDHVLIEGAGHGHDLFVSSPEIRTLMVEFMKTGKVITRRIQLPPLHFQQPGW